MKPISIYIHIPFCIKKCKYCDFLSAPADESVQKAYLLALKEEIKSQKEIYATYTVTTIFFGGGTPTVVEAELLCEVLQVIKDNYTVSEDAEISMEANPGTVTGEALQAYIAAGINRLSIGLQTASDTELEILGRIHTYEDFVQTYRLVVEAGFTNINIDLMSALPGQSVSDYESTLQKVLALKPIPQHISAYSLIVEEGTPFYKMFGAEKEEIVRFGAPVSGKSNGIHLPSEDEERDMYHLTRTLLAQAGYERYEISNYSIPGYECRHNSVYWTRGNYVGFGLGAASLVDNVRFRNTDDLQEYLHKKGLTFVKDKEVLSKEEQMEEFVFLGLRMTAGISKNEFNRVFGVTIDSIFGDVIHKSITEGLLKTICDGCIREERVALTEKGMDVSNYVMAQFLL